MLHEAQLYHHKARDYHPGLDQFLQTDPVGYEESLNLYAYVLNDPINAIDPTGAVCVGSGETVTCKHPDSNVPETAFSKPGGWPAIMSGGLMVAPQYHAYHYEFSLTDSGGEVARSEAVAEAIKNPTPGSSDSPASSAGTANDVGRIALQNVNPVISYTAEAKDGVSGATAIINVTQPGHELHPGYIIQFFTTDASGAVTYHVAGEGYAPTQSGLNLVARVMEYRIWSEQARQIHRGMDR